MKFLEKKDFDIKSLVLWTITILAMFIWIPFLWGVFTALLGTIIFFWSEEIQNFIYMEISLLPFNIYIYVMENIIPKGLYWFFEAFGVLCFICLILFFFIAGTGLGNRDWGRDDGGGDGV